MQVINSVGARTLAYDMNGAQWTEIMTFYRQHYYTQMSNGTAFQISISCLNGVTRDWEEEMVSDIISLRDDGRDLLIQLGAYYDGGGLDDGLNQIQWQLEGQYEKQITDKYGTTSQWW